MFVTLTNMLKGKLLELAKHLQMNISKEFAIEIQSKILQNYGNDLHDEFELHDIHFLTDKWLRGTLPLQYSPMFSVQLSIFTIFFWILKDQRSMGRLLYHIHISIICILGDVEVVHKVPNIDGSLTIIFVQFDQQTPIYKLQVSWCGANSI